MSEIATAVGYNTVSGGLKKILNDLMNEQYIELTHPETPKSPLQKYRLIKINSYHDPKEENLSLSEQIVDQLKNQPLSASGIANHLGHKSVSSALKKCLYELLKNGQVELTIPDKPNSRLQKYRLVPMRSKDLA